MQRHKSMAPSHRRPMQEKHPQNALDRVFKAAQCCTQSELAAFLGIRQSSISDAKRRGAVPADWLITLLEKGGINPLWVLYGQGAPRLTLAKEPEGGPEQESAALAALPLAVYSLQDLVNEIVRRALADLARKEEYQG